MKMKTTRRIKWINVFTLMAFAYIIAFIIIEAVRTVLQVIA